MDGYVPKLNLAVLLLQGGDAAQARRLLDQLLRSSDLSDQRSLHSIIRLGLAGCAASQKCWASMEEHFHVARELLDATGLIDAEVAHLAETVARWASEGGELDSADAARQLARTQWLAVGNEERARKIEA